MEFILELFDGGATLHQILEAFYKSGQMGVQYVTIQRCLQENGRGMILYKLNNTIFLLIKATVLPCTATIQHTTLQAGSSQYGTVFNPLAQHPYGNLTSTPHLQPSPGQVASVYNPNNQVSTPITPNSAPVYNWNVQADNFAISAYRYGKTISQITDQLRNNGYDRITPEDVMASLQRQGIENLRW